MKKSKVNGKNNLRHHNLLYMRVIKDIMKKVNVCPKCERDIMKLGYNYMTAFDLEEPAQLPEISDDDLKQSPTWFQRQMQRLFDWLNNYTHNPTDENVTPAPKPRRVKTVDQTDKLIHKIYSGDDGGVSK